jgi:hypothetical protein
MALACARDRLDPIAKAYVELVGAAETGGGEPYQARALLEELDGVSPSPRARYLKRQLAALEARLARRRLSFDEESKILYGVVAPPPDEEESRRVREELDLLLPGEGPLGPRYRAFQERFLVPANRLEDVLERALDESRRRVRERFPLPDEETIRLELVSGKPWPSFSSYRGGYESIVWVSRDFPVTVSGAMRIAAHEGYPGHHTIAVLRDRDLARGRGFVEFAIEPLVGPDALFVEGLAAYGAEAVLTRDERLSFEKEILFPLAGLDPAEAELHETIESLVGRLEPSAVEGARRYLDGDRDRVATAIWLENEAAVPDPWGFLRFVDRYRTYVVTYTAGREILRRRVERGADPWQALTALEAPVDDDET